MQCPYCGERIASRINIFRAAFCARCGHPAYTAGEILSHRLRRLWQNRLLRSIGIFLALLPVLVVPGMFIQEQFRFGLSAPLFGIVLAVMFAGFFALLSGFSGWKRRS